LYANKKVNQSYKSSTKINTDSNEIKIAHQVEIITSTRSIEIHTMPNSSNWLYKKTAAVFGAAC